MNMDDKIDTVIDLEKVRLDKMARRAYRNWMSQLDEEFTYSTKLSSLSLKTLDILAEGKDKNSFYIYDLIMNLLGLGSGFQFNELGAKDKIAVINQYLFLLDRFRFEYMKRLGWLESYPGEEITLVDLIIRFDLLAPGIQATPPILSRGHPSFDKYQSLNTFEQEEFIRKLIPDLLKVISGQSKTL